MSQKESWSGEDTQSYEKKTINRGFSQKSGLNGT